MSERRNYSGGKARKYLPGQILSFETVCARVLGNQAYVWWRHKPLHPGFVTSWPLLLVWREAVSGNFREAKLNPAYMPPKALTDGC